MLIVYNETPVFDEIACAVVNAADCTVATKNGITIFKSSKGTAKVKRGAPGIAFVQAAFTGKRMSKWEQIDSDYIDVLLAAAK